MSAYLAGLLLIIVQSSFASEILRNLESEVQSLLESSMRSVVTVSADFSHEIPVQADGGLLSLFKKDPEKKSVSYVNIGTGLIIDETGHVVTRSSIVMGAREIRVTLSDGNKVSADLLANDPESGFMILKIEAKNLMPARLGDSDDLNLGSWNLMVGNSLGIFPSVVFGSINGISDEGLIHITANLIPGNNGSPLINMDGEVIGLVAGRMNPQGSMTSQNIAAAGMAYPINWVKKIVADMVADKQVHKGWLGVVGYHDGQKTRIREIRDHSPAQQAGLKPEDVIVSFEQQDVKSLVELARLVQYTPPGQMVTVGYLRDGQRAETNVLMGEKIAASAATSGSVSDKHVLQDQLDWKSTNRQELLEMRIMELENEVRELRKLIEIK